MLKKKVEQPITGFQEMKPLKRQPYNQITQSIDNSNVTATSNIENKMAGGIQQPTMLAPASEGPRAAHMPTARGERGRPGNGWRVLKRGATIAKWLTSRVTQLRYSFVRSDTLINTVSLNNKPELECQC